MEFLKDLDLNIKAIEEIFTDSGDFVSRKFPVGEKTTVDIYVSYIDSLTSRDLIDENIINSLMIAVRKVPPTMETLTKGIFDFLKDGGVTTADISISENIDDAVDSMLTGDTLLLIDGYAKGIIISSKGFPNRGIPTAENEVVIQGSKEAFSEVFRFNTALIRRRIRDVNLKVKQLKVGRRSKTDVALMYLDDVVRHEILDEVLERIQKIDVDAIMDCGYIEQFIEEDWASPFPQMLITERPDTTAAAILEGRIAVLVDNSPLALIIPSTFNSFFQSSEDYYLRFEIMSFTRIFRFVAGFLAVSLPGLYIATAVFHPAMIPTPLALKMASARVAVPFPAVIEILLMDIAFELLREAGLRLPGRIGGTIGIVGGLIIGQAAVEAGIVSPIVVIVTALTGICGFVIPHISLVNGFRVTKYLIIAFSAFLGLFGFWLALLLVLIHLASLRSFGIPYLYPFVASNIDGYTSYKDCVVRFPLFELIRRPFYANPKQSIRMKKRERR